MTSTLTAPWLLPPDEAERLRTVRHYTSSVCLYEPLFAGFIDLTALIFKLPIAFVSLVDAEEVTYKMNYGLPQLIRQPRVAAVCALTIRHNAPVVFTDLTQRTQQSRLTAAAALAVQKSGVQFYASVPLRMPNQQPIGTLCVADYHTRSFGPAEQQVLEQLAQLVAQTLVTHQLCFASSWLGHEHWAHIQTALIEDLWELTALVRYLLQRSGPQVPVAPEVLAQVARRLAELHSTLTVNPTSFL